MVPGSVVILFSFVSCTLYSYDVMAPYIYTHNPPTCMLSMHQWSVIMDDNGDISDTIGESRGGLRGLQSPLSNFENKREQKIDDNPLGKEEERKSCMFV